MEPQDCRPLKQQCMRCCYVWLAPCIALAWFMPCSFVLCGAFGTLVDDDALMMHLAMQIESEEAEVFWFVLSIFNAAGGRGSTLYLLLDGKAWSAGSSSSDQNPLNLSARSSSEPGHMQHKHRRHHHPTLFRSASSSPAAAATDEPSQIPATTYTCSGFWGEYKHVLCIRQYSSKLGSTAVCRSSTLTGIRPSI